jgi:hypothetical protein
MHRHLLLDVAFRAVSVGNLLLIAVPFRGTANPLTNPIPVGDDSRLRWAAVSSVYCKSPYHTGSMW